MGPAPYHASSSKKEEKEKHKSNSIYDDETEINADKKREKETEVNVMPPRRVSHAMQLTREASSGPHVAQTPRRGGPSFDFNMAHSMQARCLNTGHYLGTTQEKEIMLVLSRANGQ